MPFNWDTSIEVAFASNLSIFGCSEVVLLKLSSVSLIVIVCVFVILSTLPIRLTTVVGSKVTPDAPSWASLFTSVLPAFWAASILSKVSWIVYLNFDPTVAPLIISTAWSIVNASVGLTSDDFVITLSTAVPVVATPLSEPPDEVAVSSILNGIVVAPEENVKEARSIALSTEIWVSEVLTASERSYNFWIPWAFVEPLPAAALSSVNPVAESLTVLPVSLSTPSLILLMVIELILFVFAARAIASSSLLVPEASKVKVSSVLVVRALSTAAVPVNEAVMSPCVLPAISLILLTSLEEAPVTFSEILKFILWLAVFNADSFISESFPVNCPTTVPVWPL